MKLKVLTEFYTKLLSDLGVYAADDGKLSYVVREGVTTPITVDGKRLCLPTRENLRDLNLDSNVIFHPLSEQVVSGPSPIINALRDYITLRLTVTSSALAGELMTLASEPKRHAKLPSAARNILKVLAEADSKSVTVLNRVLDSVSNTPETRMYNIYLRSRGTKDKPNGIRTTAVSWPILDDASSETTETFNGIKMDRKTKDKRLVVGVLNYVLRGSDTSVEEQREFTTTISHAPYFHTLLQAFVSQATWLNDVIEMFQKHIPGIEGHMFKLDYLEEFSDYENFAHKIGSAAPLLPGNSGKTVEDDGEVDDKKPLNWSSIKDTLTDEREERPRRERERDDRGGRSQRDESIPNWKRRPERSGIAFGNRRDKRSGFNLGGDSRDDRDRDRYGRDRDDRYSRREPSRSRHR